jgi:hypothetical protein
MCQSAASITLPKGTSAPRLTCCQLGCRRRLDGRQLLMHPQFSIPRLSVSSHEKAVRSEIVPMLAKMPPCSAHASQALLRSAAFKCALNTSPSRVRHLICPGVSGGLPPPTNLNLARFVQHPLPDPHVRPLRVAVIDALALLPDPLPTAGRASCLHPAGHFRALDAANSRTSLRERDMTR